MKLAPAVKLGRKKLINKPNAKPLVGPVSVATLYSNKTCDAPLAALYVCI